MPYHQNSLKPVGTESSAHERISSGIHRFPADLVAFVQQTSAEVGTEEAGSASDENSQEGLSLGVVELCRELVFRLRHLSHLFLVLGDVNVLQTDTD